MSMNFPLPVREQHSPNTRVVDILDNTVGKHRLLTSVSVDVLDSFVGKNDLGTSVCVSLLRLLAGKRRMVYA